MTTIRFARRIGALLAVLLLAGCLRSAPRSSARTDDDLAARIESALAEEARDPLAANPYLEAIEFAVDRPSDPWAAAVVATSLDRLVWRATYELPDGIDHAVAHRSRETFERVASRLAEVLPRAASHPILGTMVAFALQELALRTGAASKAADLRRQAGCVERASVVGPLAWPPRSALDVPIGIPDLGAMPSAVSGIPPFASTVPVERSFADACSLDLDATGGAGGLRALVVDLVMPKAGWVVVTAGARSALRVDVGGATVVRRSEAINDATALSFGRVWVDRGVARVVVRLAAESGDDGVALQLVSDDGAAVETRPAAPGDVANARGSLAAAIDLVPSSLRADQVVAAAATDLALGLDRRASRRLETPGALPSVPPAHVDLLRLHAARVANEWPASTLATQARATAARALASCPDCWEARLVAAQAAIDQRGGEIGVFAGLDRLEAAPPLSPARLGARSAPELGFLALAAGRANLPDLARGVLDALAQRAPGSALLADVDAQVTPRIGPARAHAACRGGASRAGAACLTALTELGDLASAHRELERLRTLRGDPTLFRRLELGQLLAHGQVDHAARLLEIMPPATRDSSLLALLDPADARHALVRDGHRLGDAPFGFEPLARLVRATPDFSEAFGREGAALLARDRREAYLPNAGTAVLLHIERYEVSARGLLVLWTYDLRRVSDTEDVASGAEAELPMVKGRWTTRELRRRIHKRDGRSIDPDPLADGAQQHADLSQLEPGDYVEQARVGWALPDEHGQLAVDGPDLLPARTSVREARVELIRPRLLRLATWAHPLLGAASTSEEADRVVTRWSLREREPRRIEEGVPDEEARVGIRFGTDSLARVARAVEAHVEQLSEPDPHVERWAREAVGAPSPLADARATIDRLTRAVGQAVPRAEAAGLTDRIADATPGVGEGARAILERRSGSRSLVLLVALRSLGIPSEVALAEARPHPSSDDLPVRTGRFTRPLVRVELDGRPTWIDADVEGPPLPPGHVSPELNGRMALRLDGRLERIEVLDGDAADAIELTIDLDERGMATGTFRASLRGRTAQHVASALERAVGTERLQLLRNLVLAWVPWADVADVRIEPSSTAWEVLVSATLSSLSFALADDRSGRRWTIPGLDPFHAPLPHPRSGPLAAHLSTQAARAAPLAIDSALVFRARRTVLLPASWGLSSLAPAMAFHFRDVSARRSGALVGRRLEESFELSLPSGVISAPEHAAFSKCLRDIDEGFAHGTRATMGEP